MFPAQALAQALVGRGWRVVLATDERAGGFAGAFPAEEVVELPSATLRARDPASIIRTASTIGRGIALGRRVLQRLEPAIVVGFGGYPSVPALLAAVSLGRRTLVHEQNAVLGRANRLLAPLVTQVATGFDGLEKASPRVAARRVTVGNPVRPEIRALAGLPYAPPTDELRILVTGGSQGARLLSETAPRALAALPEAVRLRLRVDQQARPESADAARSVYADALIGAEVSPFFRDMAARLARAHLVIGRSGASTVTELMVAGRPSILVPLGVALDDDQGRNAAVLTAAGAAEVILEADLTVERMCAAVGTLIASPARLSAMAGAAASLARPDAADRLADLVEQVAR